MNPAVLWLKKNWIIAVLAVVALASLPTLWYFAGKKNKALVDRVQTSVKADFDEVSKDRQNYTLPPALPSAKEFSFSAPPNKIINAYFGERLTEQQKQIASVWSNALEFNQGDHKPLIENFFPKPDEFYLRTLTGDLTIAFVVELPKRLVAIVNGGPAPDADKLAATLRENAERSLARIQTEKGRDATAEEWTKIKEELLGVRVARYKQAAQDISVYVDAASFSDIPDASKDPNKPLEQPTIRKAWDYQEIAWLYDDILKAVALANSKTGSAGGDVGGGVPQSVVKRIVSMKIGPVSLSATASADGTAPAADAPIPKDYNNSVTGRIGGVANQLFDVRPVTIDVIVSSKHLPHFIDALAETNFMTVLDVDLTNVEPLDELKLGYYYGDDHIVRAVVQVETIWLRDWTRLFMPLEVKADRGVFADPVAPPADGAQPPAPPGDKPPTSGSG
ncbi:MAG: hypothetical protein H7Y88_07645 [Phycisphaerales bacterium]|nr:hypothetical protein [Phycisphaerales bacterium]